MSLDDIRDAARTRIHEAFAIPAVVRSESGLQIPVTARLHRDMEKAFGDLDREGFALRMEFRNQVVFDTCEWMPKENWLVDFGRGRVFEINHILDGEGERFIRTEVTGVE